MAGITMSYRYKSLVLCGFRATGKSTIAAIVSKKLGWKYIEMDTLIVERAGKTIPELTQNGTSWQPFRKLETTLLKELVGQEFVVISCGGGVGVNTISATADKTYGDLQREVLCKAIDSLVVLLRAPVETLTKRILEDELQKDAIQRPVLNQERAKELELQLSSTHDLAKQKHILSAALVQDAIEMYKQREPLYEKMSSTIIDTATQTPEEAAKELISKVTLKPYENLW